EERDERSKWDFVTLATGMVVFDVQAAFDDYWNSASVYEVGRVITATPDLDALRMRMISVDDSAKVANLKGQLRNSIERLRSGEITPEWTRVQLIVDDPIKGTGSARKDQLMITRLTDVLGNVEQRLDLVSAYFIPGQTGSAYFEHLAQNGKSVAVLTNAMNTTDVLIVHAGYARYRRKLLRAGIRLYELKLRGPMSAESDQQIRPLGLSGGSLHAKTFAVDGQRVFIGSFNFDPRSALLNCEMGLLIESQYIAARIHEAFDQGVASFSYRPQLTPEDRIVWTEIVDGRDTITYQEEPGASWFQRITLAIVKLLPVEWLL
ncbi:MAG: phospholipase D-like domain-containing protein, partial [Brachymonas sp.]